MAAVALVPASAGLNPPRGTRLTAVRRGVHALAIVAGWALYFWGWHRVLAGHPDFHDLRVLVIGAAVVVPVVTVSWILHNLGIHRRKGPRRSVTAATLDYRVDFNRREVVADFAALAGAQRVHIVVEGGRKRYLAEGGDVGAGGSGDTGGTSGADPLTADFRAGAAARGAPAASAAAPLAPAAPPSPTVPTTPAATIAAPAPTTPGVAP